MAVQEQIAKSILRRQKRVDSWFLSSASMNLYRGCAHNCAYCDGRAEKYQVEGVFERDLVVKVNALELLERELDPARRRKPFAGGYFFLGGGVGDSYMHLEEHYGITRKALELLERFSHPVHVLTKSTLLLRDVDIFSRIHQKSDLILSMSFSTLDDSVASIYEPGAPPPTDRLSVLAHLKSLGFNVGIYLMPLIPGVSDKKEQLRALFSAAMDAQIDFVVPAGMTLKTGRQRDHFTKVLKAHHPSLLPLYGSLYGGDRYGSPQGPEAKAQRARINEVAFSFPIPKWIPERLFPATLSPPDRARILASHGASNKQ